MFYFLITFLNSHIKQIKIIKRYFIKALLFHIFININLFFIFFTFNYKIYIYIYIYIYYREHKIVFKNRFYIGN